MANEGTLAAAALVVALVALLTAVGQMLQQYFSTADGYRRCQPSVIGPWASKTQLRFRWSQFRLETLFTVPHITLYRTTWASASAPECPYRDGDWVAGADHGESKGLGLLISGSVPQDSVELVTWLRFLRAIQWTHKKMLSRLSRLSSNEKEDFSLILQENRKLTIPIVRLEQRSWDFMPPDVVRPYARINLGDLAILARRLGMDWDRFEPSDGILRAQGNGYTLTSVFVRSVGTMVEINEILGSDVSGSSLPWLNPVIPEHVERKMLLIPCAAADKMNFGILPGVGSDFIFRDFDVSSIDAFRSTIRYFTQDEGIVAAFVLGQWQDQGWCPGISDLLPLIAPICFRPELGIMGLPAPDNGLFFRASVTSASPCFVEFHSQVKDLISTKRPAPSSPLYWVLEQLEVLTSSSDEWVNEINWLQRYWHDKSSTSAVSPQKRIYASYRSATTLLMDIPNENQPKRSMYVALVSQHIREMFDHMHVFGRSYSHALYPYPNPTGKESDIWAKRMAVYFQRLPALAVNLAKKGVGDEDTITAAWVLMMFRAMCWQRCHKLVSGKTVPVEYCGSQMPVYIG